MVVCWRCGVDFDPTDYILGAPCSDCQLDYPDNYLKLSVVVAQEAARRDKLIRELHFKRYSDSEIGEAIGMPRHRVQYWRGKLGLEAHQFKGDEKWRDPEKVREDLRKRMVENPIVQYRKTVSRTGAQREGLPRGFTDEAKKNTPYATRFIEQTNGAKLTHKQVDEIRDRLDKHETGAALAREYKVSESTISRIKTGAGWTSW
jgi:DNA invertase Pin-like site-specific DNA recombinase